MTDFLLFISKLEHQLKEPLPGIGSQLKMASMRRIVKDGKLVIPDDVRKAGVLVLFYPDERDIRIAFIRRAEYPGVHSGQISFPGGAWEDHDASLTITALREAEEETGIDRKDVHIIGRLSELFIPPSNFLVTPVVAYTMTRPHFVPDPQEVESILEISINRFLDKDSIQEKEISIFPDIRFKVPCFYIDGQIIWGATAMMMSELVEIINQGALFHT